MTANVQMDDVKDLLLEADYAVVVSRIHAGVVRATFPNGLIQLWGVEQDESGEYSLITNLVSEEEITCPSYAVPWVLTTRTHLDCLGMNYHPSYIIYGDEQEDMGGIIPVSDIDLTRYESLTTILRTMKPDNDINNLREWAALENVLEGFDTCFEIVNGTLEEKV